VRDRAIVEAPVAKNKKGV